MHIQPLDHKRKEVAKELYNIWQRSYPIEGKLIGMKVFPPLQRTLDEFENANTDFIGIIIKKQLIAAIEYKMINEILDIHSFVVDPDHLRKGYGKKLMEHILEYTTWNNAIIETAEKNIPAIGLYQKMGFKITEVYIAAMNISKVKMELVKQD